MAEALQEIDIGGGPLRIEGQQVDSEDGHRVEEHLRVVAIPANTEQTRFFERTFTFNCNNMTTSFQIRITLTRKCASVSCVTVLRRTDGLPGLVDVELSTTVGQLRPEACARHIFNRVESGRRYADSAHIIIGFDAARRSVGIELPLVVKLAVQGCHGALDLPVGVVETMDTGDSEDSSSRKRRGTMDIGDSVDASEIKRPRT